MTEELGRLSRRQSDSETKITKIEAQLSNLSAINKKLDIVQRLTTNMALLAQKHKMSMTEINRAFEELNELRDLIEENKSIALLRLEKEHDRADSIHSDLQALVNKGKGAWVVATILAGTLGTAIVGVLLWSLNEIVVLKTLVSALAKTAGG